MTDARERPADSADPVTTAGRTGTLPSEAGDVSSSQPPQPARSASPLARTLREVAPTEYDIESEAGRGGTGIVYRARDVRLDRVVAVKELKRPDAATQVRFEREMRITARLQHPGIVPVHEAGRWPSGRAFYAMKLVEGRPLKELVEEAPTFESRLGLLEHVIAIADTIAYAHGQGVIHRDLKPSNVIVGAYGEVVVIDWGLAKDLRRPAEPLAGNGVYREPSDPDATKAGAILGTPGFMAPEQARGDDVDERTDVYALGAILYCVLSGQAPYAGGSPEELIAQVLVRSPIPLPMREPRVPRELTTIVDKAMARDPHDRYSSAQSVVEDLKRFRQGELVGAHAYSRRELAARWLRRHRTVTLVAAAAALLLGVVATGSYRSVISERDRWKHERAIAVSRANELLLQRARASLVSDPTASLAALATYPDEGPDWGDAREIATEAAARGVAHHIWRHYRHDVTRSRFVDRDRRILSTSSDGRMLLVDAASAAIVASYEGVGQNGEIALSPDGRLAAVTGLGGAVLLLDLDHYEKPMHLGGDPGLINALIFVPHDGTLLSGGSDGRLLRWPDPLHRPQQTVVFASMGEPIAAIAAIGQAGDIALGTTSGLIQVRDRVGRLRHEWHVGAAIVELDGSRAEGATTLACSTATGEFWRFDVNRDHGDLLRTATDKGYSAVEFSPDGETIALAGADGEVWTYGRTASQGTRLSKDAGEIYPLVFSPDGLRLAAAGIRGVVRVWSLPDAVLRVRMGHTAGIYTLAFASYGASLVSGGDDQTLRLWQLTEPSPVVLRGPRDDVSHVLFDPKGRWVAADNRDGGIYVWDLTTHTMRQLGAHRDFAYGLALSPDTTTLASAGWDGTVRLWPLDGRPPVELRGHNGIVWDVAYSPDGGRLATGGADGTVRVWRPDGHAEIVLNGHDGEVLGVMFFSTDSLISSGNDGILRIWELASGRNRILRGHSGEVRHLAAVAGSRNFLSAGRDGTVRLWSFDDGQTRLVIHHDAPVRDVAISPSGNLLASVGEDGAVRLWDLATGDARAVYRGHGPAVRRARFSPDGNLLVSGGTRGLLHLWRLRDGAYATVQAHDGMVLDIAMSADGKQVATSSTDRTVRLWQLADFETMPKEPSELRAWMRRMTDEAAR
jgi:eukaryotic-like serine/threonine-protein kinase